MSGHSKWSQIKHKKAATDEKRGQIFSKISKMISLAARKGENPEANPALRLAIEKAKSMNMPNENIRRAIEKGTDKGKENFLEELTIESFGPGGAALIIEAITDNKNRALPEIKNIISKHNGRLAKEGSVRWMFKKQGIIDIAYPETSSKENLELNAIDAGAEDIKFKEGSILQISVKTEDLEKVKNNLKKKGIEIESSDIEWTPVQTIEINENTRQDLNKLFEELDEQPDVKEIYSNAV